MSPTQDQQQSRSFASPIIIWQHTVFLSLTYYIKMEMSNMDRLLF